jgi:hypothetical protein
MMSEGLRILILFIVSVFFWSYLSWRSILFSVGFFCLSSLAF